MQAKPLFLGAALAWSVQATADRLEPDYVGRTQCSPCPCRAEETARWSGSHHDLAMQED